MNTPLAAKMLNIALKTEDTQLMKAVIMDAMDLLGMDKDIQIPEPKQPSKMQIRIKKAMHERQLASVHGPV